MKTEEILARNKEKKDAQSLTFDDILLLRVLRLLRHNRLKIAQDFTQDNDESQWQ